MVVDFRKTITNFGAVALLLSGCAASQLEISPRCYSEEAFSAGARDGAEGKKASFAFARQCPLDLRKEAIGAYRRGFEANRPRKKTVKLQKDEKEEKEDLEISDAEVELEENSPAQAGEPVSMPPTAVPLPVRDPNGLSWVCEVEASSKIFTGVGVTKDEALGSAKANCGAHFQASYCTKADCKQNL